MFLSLISPEGKDYENVHDEYLAVPKPLETGIKKCNLC